jgi:hypothetical protein
MESATTPAPGRPSGCCETCFRVWRASRPRPDAVRCWHGNVIARLRNDGSWLVTAGERILRRNTPPDVNEDKEP